VGDSDIDRLYQLPLSEFTKTRDDLAKRAAGMPGAAIRKLQKPNLAAWAVNQLYWRDRGTYEALVSAAQKLRSAQMASLGGKTADVPKAEGAHSAARKSALNRIRAMLDDAGERASPATLTAIQETLDALPADGPPGRLVRPLKPAGFEALAGLLGGRRMVAKRAEVVPFRPSAKERAAEDKRQTREAERQAERREKTHERVAQRLREAETAEREAGTALERSRRALVRAEHAHAEVSRRLEQAAETVESARRDVQAAERRASQTAIARATLEKQRDALS
jgi:hypothetical protein